MGNYPTPFPFTGVIDEVRIYHAALSAEQIAARHSKPVTEFKTDALMLSFSFNKGQARDFSEHKNHGTIAGTTAVKGQIEQGLKFSGKTKKGGGRQNQFAGSLVQRHWNRDVPLIVQAIAIADQTLFVAGPPDVLDEEAAFERLRAGDPQIQKALDRQNDSVNGKRGGMLLAVSIGDGKTLAEITLDSLPVWDGMAIAGGRLYIAGTNGEVVCLAPEK